MGRADGMGVAGEVDIDFVFGHHPGDAAASAAALDAKNGPQRRLPEVDRDLMSQTTHALGEADGGGGLALAGGGRGDAGNDH